MVVIFHGKLLVITRWYHGGLECICFVYKMGSFPSIPYSKTHQ